MSYELNPQVTSSKTQVTSSEIRITSSNPQIMSSNPWVTSSNLQLTSSNPRVQQSLNQLNVKKKQPSNFNQKLKIISDVINFAWQRNFQQVFV